MPRGTWRVADRRWMRDPGLLDRYWAEFEVAAPRIVGVIYGTRTFSYVREQDRRDVMQECLVATWMQWPTVRELPVGRRQAYLRQITHNKVVRYIRDQRRLSPEVLTEFVPDHHPGESLDDQLDRFPNIWHEDLWKAIADLPQRQRAVLLLKYVDELKIREIAEMLEISEGTVKSTIHDAKAALRTRLPQIEDASP